MTSMVSWDLTLPIRADSGLKFNALEGVAWEIHSIVCCRKDRLLAAALPAQAYVIPRSHGSFVLILSSVFLVRPVDYWMEFPSMQPGGIPPRADIPFYSMLESPGSRIRRPGNRYYGFDAV